MCKFTTYIMFYVQDLYEDPNLGNYQTPRMYLEFPKQSKCFCYNYILIEPLTCIVKQ